MKLTSILFSLGLVSASTLCAYDIRLSDGTVGANSATFATMFGAKHWDGFSLNWNPNDGEACGFLAGNHQSLGTTIELQPDSPEQAGQTVSLLLNCQVEETQTLAFQNYQPRSFDYHYGFQVTVWADPSKSSPYLARYDLTPGQSDVLLSLTVGTPVWVEFFVSPAAIHDAHDNYLTAWHPAVLEPASTGQASVDAMGVLKPLSIQVVPEPTALSLGLLAAALAIGMSRGANSTKLR